MDEVALMARADPVVFRIGLLDGAGRNALSAPSAVGGAKRQAVVLKRAAKKAGWGTGMARDTGLGVATTFGQSHGMPTWVACVARVRVDRRSGAVAVEKLTIVVDAGTVVQTQLTQPVNERLSIWGRRRANEVERPRNCLR
jgi:isoquinoline 1-oxidoreductase subunit beta